MKDKQQRLEDLDFITELTMSEQEKINGGSLGDMVLNTYIPPNPGDLRVWPWPPRLPN